MSDGTKLSRQSDAIAERLGKISGLNGMAKQAKAEFVAANKTLQGLTTKAGTAETARDKSVRDVIDADVSRDKTVDDLADAIVTAKLGKRSNPFAGYSKHTAAKMVRLGHKAEGVAVRALGRELMKKKPPSGVVKLINLAVQKSVTVEKLLKAQDAPKAAYAKAFAARDAFLPTLQKAWAVLDVQMQAALANDPGAYDALFAPPVDEAPPAPRKRKPKAKAKAAATTTPAAAPTNGAAAPS